MTKEEMESLYNEFLEIPSILKGSFREYVTLRSKYSKEEIEKGMMMCYVQNKQNSTRKQHIFARIGLLLMFWSDRSKRRKK